MTGINYEIQKFTITEIIKESIKIGAECPYRKDGDIEPYCSLYPHLRSPRRPFKCDYQESQLVLTDKFRAYHKCCYTPNKEAEK